MKKSKSFVLKRLSYVWIIFFIVNCYIILALISQEIIYDDSIYYKSYANQFNKLTIDELLSLKSDYVWISYTIIPLTLMIKFGLVSLCIGIGNVFSNTNIEFRQIFRASVLGEWIFIIAQVIFVLILYSNLDEVTLQNASGYFPLSALSFIGLENANAQWVIYPLQTLNLFEVFYMVAIAWLLSRTTKQSFADIFSIVLPSYGIGLLLWITLVAFLTFQVT